MDILCDKLTKSLTKRSGHDLKREALKKETESLLIAAQNNIIRTNYIKAKIDKSQQNSKCRLCGDR